MAEFKGTKGKWELEINNYYPEIRVWQENKSFSLSTHINIVNANGIFEDNSLCEENKANALLISKAPEMLEMLQDILEQRLDGRDYVSISDIQNLIKESTEL